MSPACCTACRASVDIPKVSHNRFAANLILQSLKVRSRPAHSDDSRVETMKHDGDLAANAFACASHKRSAILKVNLQRGRIDFHKGEWELRRPSLGRSDLLQQEENTC